MSKDAEKKDYKEAAKFISENMKLFSEKETKNKKTGKDEKTVVFTVNKAEYDKFMKERGINKATLQTVADANVEYNNAANIVVTDELISRNAARVSIRTSTGFSRNDVGVIDKRTNNNPQTGGVITKIGNYTFHSHVRGIDADLAETLRDKIKKHLGE